MYSFILFIGIFLLLIIVLLLIINYLFKSGKSSSFQLKWVFINFIFLFALSFEYIGPPFWYISAFSTNSLFNQASMNGVYTFVKSFQQENIYERDLINYNKKKIDFYKTFIRNEIKDTNEIFTSENYITSRIKKSNNKLNNNRKSVILLISESFGTKWISLFNPNSPCKTSNFDSISKKGILCTRCYANGHRTQYAILSVIGGFPAVITNNPLRRKGINEFHTIGTVLKNAGYQTSFYTSGDVTYDDMDMFLKQGGFEIIKDKNDIKNPRFVNEWGACDEYLFDFTLNEIKNLKKPFFVTLLNVSNHAPWDIPVYYKEKFKVPETRDKRQVLIEYADYSFGNFYNSLYQKYKDSIMVILVGDHGEAYEINDCQFKIHHVPLLFLNTGYQPQVIDKICSQIDISTTIVDLLNINKPYHFIGKNIFNDNKLYAVCTNVYKDIILVTDSIICLYNTNTKTNNFLKCNADNYLYNIDLNKNITNFNNISVFLNNYIESISYIYQTNKYRIY